MMVRPLLFLLGKLRDRSQSKTEAQVKVNIQQKITVVTIRIDNRR